MKKPSTIGDLSAVITGILLALNVPYTLPWWIMVIGAVIAIGVGKLTFGGIGQNVFNPALVGRVFLLVSYPSQMTHWEQPQGLFGVDAITGATPLGAAKEGTLGQIDYADMLFANIGGSAGEVCAIALLIGFIYLLCRRVIKPWITLSIFATVALTSLLFWGINPERFTDPLFNLLTGGLILGACFMATDYVTSPMSLWGGVIFGVGIGFLTMMIRYFGSYPEGVSFAILIMNSFVPLLNRWFHQKKFGRK
jgi:electron transport complex protein RnfD